MTVQEAMNRIRQNADVATGSFDDDAAVDALNDATMEFVEFTDILQTTEIQNVLANTHTYQVNSDFIRILGVYHDNEPISPVIRSQIDREIFTWLTDTGTPDQYMVVNPSNRELRLLPIPSAALTNGLEVAYVRQPVTYVNTPAGLVTQLDTPVQFHSYLWKGACLQPMMKMGDLEERKLLANEWQIGLIRGKAYRNNVDLRQRYRRTRRLPADQRFIRLPSNYPHFPI